MTQRLNAFEHGGEIFKQLNNFGNAAAKGLDPTLKELVLIRASQINHCAACLDMHTKDARHRGETEERLALVAAFEESGHLFSEKEQAALALTEAVTLLTDGFVPDAVYDRAAKHFDEIELTHLISLIAAINAYNRVNVTARTQAGFYQPGKYGG
jgi:AhpD family alkylhydroperoxidase